MISASKEFKEKLKNGANLVNYADITLSDGEVLHLTYKDFMIGGCQIEDKTTDGKFGVGYVIGKTLSIKLENNDERFSKYDFYQSIINLYVAVQLDDGSIEKIRKGVFYTVVPETPGDIIEISAVDGMYQLDKDYSASTTAYPATLQSIISDACLDCGIPIGFTQFDNMNYVVQEKPEKATYRQIVSYACQIAGYNAHIDNNGYMQLIWYNSALLEQYNYDGGNFKTYPHDTVIDGGNFTNYSTDTIISGGNFSDEMPEHIFKIKSFNVSTDDVQVTGVRVLGEDKAEALFGEEGYVIEVSGNPFANGKEQEVANYLGNRIIGMLFRPFTAQILNNPLYEPFDVVRVSDRKGNVYISIINSVSYKIGGYTQISCEAEDPVRNGSRYVSAAAQAVVEARRNTEKQLTTYDKAVQQMNQLAMNAMGFHTTVEDMEDGSRIVYLHDKPALEDSKTIYKQTIDGFFISTDGGKSYTAGFDSQGNAVVNILYAIGIVADWIQTGKLVAKKGNNTTFLVDVDTGEVRIVADSFSLTSGDTIDSIAEDKASSAAGNALTSANKYTDSASKNVLDSAKAYADSTSKNAVNAQTQQDIFNKLTNNGQAKGIFLRDGQLYISFTYAQGGTLTLGGANNEHGNLKVLNESGNAALSLDNSGFYIREDAFNIDVDATSIENHIRLICTLSNSKYMANLNPTGISANQYSLDDSGEWEVDNSSALSSSLLSINNNAGHTYVKANYIQMPTGQVIVGSCYMANNGVFLNNGYTNFSINGIIIGNTESTVAYYTRTSMHCRGQGFFDKGLSVSGGNLTVSGSLSVTGTKNRKVLTNNYGERLLCCYELAKPYFGDIGEAVLDENGICYIVIDDILSETITTEIQYQVFLQKYGQGDLWIDIRKNNYFVVKGTPNLKFGWELKAIQKGFEMDRLEKFEDNRIENIDYEYEAINYITNYYQEVLNV